MHTIVHFKNLLSLCSQVKLTQLLENENIKCFHKVNGALSFEIINILYSAKPTDQYRSDLQEKMTQR
jgi:hypothetical protein